MRSHYYNYYIHECTPFRISLEMMLTCFQITSTGVGINVSVRQLSIKLFERYY